jgi:hypothetical protein
MNDDSAISKELSTTSLAKELNMTSQSVFQMLLDMGLIARNGSVWDLTPTGLSRGGSYRDSVKYGRYIVWPNSIITDLDDSNEPSGHPITATSIGKNYNLPANRVNSILSELGWIKKDPINGWLITELGKRIGGIQSKYKTGVPYVRWPSTIMNNKILSSSIHESKGDIPNIVEDKPKNDSSDTQEFRERFPATNRTKDGHLVRSKAETIIDNWIYEAKIVHAYERKLPIEEEVYCDFWIPTGKVYIEYWGLEDQDYLARKEKKLLIYKKHNFNLIQLSDKEVANIDDVLPAKLREYGIAVE